MGARQTGRREIINRTARQQRILGKAKQVEAKKNARDKIKHQAVFTHRAGVDVLLLLAFLLGVEHLQGDKQGAATEPVGVRRLMENVNNSKATFPDNSGSVAEGNRTLLPSGERRGVAQG